MFVVLMAAGAAAEALSTADPFDGQEKTHAIKALSAEEIDGLLAGRGLGYAKAAELNSYPGPTHVLELANQLALTAGQRAAVEAAHAIMAARAKSLGASLVEAERAFDQAFAHATITPPTLAEMTGRIGTLGAELRAAHLEAHLATRAVLGPRQIAVYDQLRGYAGEAPEHHHEGMKHGG